MGVGIMRQTFERVLTWAKSDTRGSKEVIIQKQSVADLLIKIKTRCEATRALVWKAAHCFWSHTVWGGAMLRGKDLWIRERGRVGDGRHQSSGRRGIFLAVNHLGIC